MSPPGWAGLAKAERWSGFGDFGDTTTVSTVARSSKAKAEPKQTRKKPALQRAAQRRPRSARELEDARTALAAAERAKDDADSELSDDNPTWRWLGCVMTRCASASRKPSAT